MARYSKHSLRECIETTYLVGGLVEKVISAGTTDYRHYIYAAGARIAIYSRMVSGVNTLRYVREDQQGSISALLADNGTSYVKESFTAFGSRRSTCTWSGKPTAGNLTLINSVTRRGYTWHTALGAMGLNDMNGRIQDAITGRFLSPDPYITDPTFTQSYNRYSYVNNNPLSYTDPSGFAQAPANQRPKGGAVDDTVLTVVDGKLQIVTVFSSRWIDWDSPSYTTIMNKFLNPQSPVQQLYQLANMRMPVIWNTYHPRPKPPAPKVTVESQGEKQNLLDKLKDWMCKAPAATATVQAQVDAGVGFDAESQLSLTVTTHGQFIVQYQQGTLWGLNVGAAASVSAQGGVLWKDAPAGTSPTSSYVATGS